MSEEVEAGRELDVRVAAEVMGFEWWRSSVSGNRSLFPPGYIPRGADEWFLERADMTEPLCFDFPSHVPHYSTDIVAAWEVVEKVCQRTKWYELSFRPQAAIANFTGNTSDEARGFLDECDGNRQKAQALAICRAALAALEGDLA